MGLLRCQNLRLRLGGEDALGLLGDAPAALLGLLARPGRALLHAGDLGQGAAAAPPPRTAASRPLARPATAPSRALRSPKALPLPVGPWTPAPTPPSSSAAPPPMTPAR